MVVVGVGDEEGVQALHGSSLESLLDQVDVRFDRFVFERGQAWSGEESVDEDSGRSVGQVET